MTRQKRGGEPGWDRKSRAKLTLSGFEMVKFADTLRECPDCGDAWCDKHQEHYVECPCIGPTEDDVEYEICQEGELMGKRINQESEHGQKQSS